MTTLHTATRTVPYTADAAAYFEATATPTDAVLLEAADIESKKHMRCMAILRSSLRVTCSGQRVTVHSLTATGAHLLAHLNAQLGDFRVQAADVGPKCPVGGDDQSGARRSASDVAVGPEGKDDQAGEPESAIRTHVDVPAAAASVFEFSVSTAADERERLLATSPVEVLRQLLRAPYESEHLPFLGGGFAFDFLETFEELPPVAEGTNTFPDYEFVVAETLVKIDHLTESAQVTAVNIDADELARELTRVAAASPQGSEGAEAPSGIRAKADGQGSVGRVIAKADIPDFQFRADVKKMQAHIECGDIYQVVPARTFTVKCPDAFAAYLQLRDTNPSPYMFYVRGSDYELFGASPESNLKFDSATRQVEVYPIAGTRPRGATPELDIRNELDMRTDHKELAEHTMLVDLARNDLARVAVPGTRHVKDLLQVDRYSRVMHLVSRVVAELDPDFDALDAYRACMNMGTLTGAPKLEAMALLRSVERKRRGAYGGAVGYVDGTGSMDTAIVIRSAFVRGGMASVQAGAGVVRDSRPQSEADETVHKAYAVLHAIALAQRADVEVER